MIEFIVRARSAPADAGRFLAAVGAGVGVEYLADITRNALFISQGHRADSGVSLVLEKSRDLARVVRINGANLGSLPGLHESALLQVIADALRAGAGLTKEARVTDARGIAVTATSFERYVKAQTSLRDVFLLDVRGADLRSIDLPGDAAFVLTDHIPMPRNTVKSMLRQGVRKISVGPVTLHAAQCIALVHNELDRRRAAPLSVPAD